MAAKPLIWGHIFAPRNILYFFQVILFNFKTQYQKHIFKIYLEKQKKKGGFALLNKSLELSKLCLKIHGPITRQRAICDDLRDLVPFAQFIKREKPATLLKVTLLHRCFPRFSNSTNGIKSRKTSHRFQ